MSCVKWLIFEEFLGEDKLNLDEIEVQLRESVGDLEEAELTELIAVIASSVVEALVEVGFARAESGGVSIFSETGRTG